MDDKFLNGLKAIKNSDPEKAVEVMYNLFRSVENMKVADLVAAKRTLDLFRSMAEVGEVETRILDQMDEAILTKAVSIWEGDLTEGIGGRGIHHDEWYPSLRSAFGSKFKGG